MTNTTLTFPNAFAAGLAEGAIKRDQDRQEADRRVTDLIRTTGRARVLRVVTLDMDRHVVEIGDGSEPPLYAVVLNGKADAQRFYSFDEALLRAIALRNGASINDQGHVYTARALGVKPTVDY